MPYRDTQLRERLGRLAEAQANHVQDDLPETKQERTARQNPKVLDISGSTIIGLSVIEGMTT